ncbi:MAG TPA: CPBP family intramembrane glutamic endopeptidase [Anaerolineae bacterium]|nr:CPBP family intramembrane glutamic endopeptidase [Anaerolineae bacterium]
MNEPTAVSMNNNRRVRIKHNPVIDLVLLLVRPRAVPATSSTVVWIKRHPLVALVSLAYGLTWIGSVLFVANPAAASQRGVISFTTVFVALFMLGGCLWAAFIVETAAGGITNRLALLRRLRLFRWRVNIGWYATALLLPAGMMLAGVWLASVLSGTANQIPLLAVPPSAWLTVIFMNIGAYVIGNFEEFAWRGVALPHLQATQFAVKAALIVGIIQAIWHLPYFFTSNSLEQQLGPLGFLLWNIALSIVITWIFNNAKGSLLIAILFHAANDGWSALLMPSSSALPVLLTVAVEVVVAIALIAVFGAKRLSRKPEAELVSEIITL